MLNLSQRNRKLVLRFEQDQRSDAWIPEEDEECVPHKLTYDFLVFLGRDPASEEFHLKSSEIEDVINTRFAIELAPAKGSLIETICSVFMDTIVWKDRLKNRFIGICRDKFGRYGEPKTGSNKLDLRDKLLGLEVVKSSRNIHR